MFISLRQGYGRQICVLNPPFRGRFVIREIIKHIHRELIQVFPAIPPTWKSMSFERLRAEGAFIISARRENGKTK